MELAYLLWTTSGRPTVAPNRTDNIRGVVCFARWPKDEAAVVQGAFEELNSKDSKDGEDDGQEA